MSPWKLLAAAALLVPPTAYVAGVLTSAADEPVTRETLQLPGVPASVEPRVVLTRVPTPPQEPTGAGAADPAGPPQQPPGSPIGSRGDCDDDGDDDDGVDVIRPCPDDLGDDRDDDDDDDDRDDDDDDDGGDDD